jgi:hypothetical protein
MVKGSRLVTTQAVIQRKRGLVSVESGFLNNLNGQCKIKGKFVKILKSRTACPQKGIFNHATSGQI